MLLALFEEIKNSIAVIGISFVDGNDGLIKLFES